MSQEQRGHKCTSVWAVFEGSDGGWECRRV